MAARLPAALSLLVVCLSLASASRSLQAAAPVSGPAAVLAPAAAKEPKAAAPLSAKAPVLAPAAAKEQKAAAPLSAQAPVLAPAAAQEQVALALTPGLAASAPLPEGVVSLAAKKNSNQVAAQDALAAAQATPVSHVSSSLNPVLCKLPGHDHRLACRLNMCHNSFLCNHISQ